jgi:hypothetical protein
MIDIIGAKTRAHEFLNQVRFFVGALSTAKARQRR